MFRLKGLKRLLLVFLFSIALIINCNIAKAQDTNFIDINQPLSVDSSLKKISMSDAIKLALLNNPKVSIEEALVDEKKWAIKEEKSYLYPQFYVYQDFSVSNSPLHALVFELQQRDHVSLNYDMNNPGTKSNFSTRIGGQVTILDRALYNRIDIKELEFEIQKQIGRKEVYDLVSSVRKAFLDLQISKEKVSNAQANISFIKEHFKAVSNKKDQGQASKSDFLGAKVKLATAEEKLAIAKNNLNLAWISFADIVGDDNVIGYDLVDDMKSNYSVDDIDKLVKYSYLHRPEVASIEKYKEKAVLDLNLAKKTGAMTINAHGDWGLDTIFDDSKLARSFIAAVYLKKSIFDGGLRRSKIKQAKAQVSKRDAEIDQIYRQIKVEVVQNYLSLMNASERLTMTDSLVEDAEESLRAYNERYVVGLSNNVEVESAQAKLSDARILKAHALYDYKLSVVNLQRSIGMPLSAILDGKGLSVFEPPSVLPAQSEVHMPENQQEKEQIQISPESEPNLFETQPEKNIFELKPKIEEKNIFEINPDEADFINKDNFIRTEEPDNELQPSEEEKLLPQELPESEESFQPSEEGDVLPQESPASEESAQPSDEEKSVPDEIKETDEPLQKSDLNENNTQSSKILENELKVEEINVKQETAKEPFANTETIIQITPDLKMIKVPLESESNNSKPDVNDNNHESQYLEGQ
ncbi:MAG: TolC family protein [Cyanobacteriota bacterium]